MTTSVVCVLKTGGDFNAGHVARLMHQVKRHSPPETPFICLTDDPGVPASKAKPLEHSWPGWWSKVESWRMPGPILALDLDVTITGSLTPLLEAAAQYEFILAANFWTGDPHKLNSSVMAWRSGAPRHLYDLFVLDPQRWMREGKARDRWGDQGFVAAHHHGLLSTWQRILPGMIMSYKRGVRLGEDVRNCRVCVSHGQPRPWASGGADEWLRENRLLGA